MFANATPVAPALPEAVVPNRLTGLPLDNLISSHRRCYPPPAHDKGICFYLPLVCLRVLMATTLLMANYWTFHKYCQPEPTTLTFFFTACHCLSSLLHDQCLPSPANKASAAFPSRSKKRPSSFSQDSLPVFTYSIWIWTNARRKSSDTSHTKWEGGQGGNVIPLDCWEFI